MSELVRASDADRESAVASLREHLVQGRLSLEDFTQRMGAAYAAATSVDLAELEHDLPAPAPAAAPERRRRSVGFLLSIFGSTARAGSFRVRKHVVCVAIFGAVALDLRGALLEDDVVNVHSLTVFGGLDVVVPEGVEVDLTGLALFGAKETKGTGGTPPPGAPLVRVNALVLFGGATVAVKPR
jgi:hypothetical protein